MNEQKKDNELESNISSTTAKTTSNRYHYLKIWILKLINTCHINEM